MIFATFRQEDKQRHCCSGEFAQHCARWSWYDYDPCFRALLGPFIRLGDLFV